MFILICVALLIVTAIILVLPWLRRGASREVAASELNARLREEQRQDLDERLAQGLLAPEAHEQLCLELDKRLLEDVIETDGPEFSEQSSKLLITALVVFVMICASAFYVQFGQYNEQKLGERFNAVFNAQNPDVAKALMVYQDIAAYATPASSENIEWLYMAAQGYTQVGHFRKSSELYDRMVVVAGDEAQLLASAAQAHYLANNRVMNNTAQSYLERALMLNPHQQNALGFAGMAAFENDRFSEAASYWQRALASLPTDKRDGNVLQGALTEAKRRATLQGDARGDAETTQSSVATAARSINISLRLGDGITVSANKTVFVLARAKNGPPMPLAAKRIKVADLPVQLTLSTADAMTPAFSLASFDNVVVTARISQSGNAITQSGDIGANEVDVRLGEAPVGVVLLLDRPI